MSSITSFSGENRWLSNFWPCYIDGILTTVEHKYQACKCENDEDVKLILAAKTPGEAKKLGRKVKICDDWDAIKVGVMRELLSIKFDREINPGLYTKLMATKGYELIETNNWGDVFWGVCNGVGKNMLGKILMEIRDENNSSSL